MVETLLLETLNSPRERGKTLSALHHGTGWCQWVPLKIGFATSKMSWFIMVHHHFPRIFPMQTWPGQREFREERLAALLEVLVPWAEKLISSCNLPVIRAIYRGYMGT